MQPTHPDAIPRFQKWDLTKLKTALERRELQFIEASQVRQNPITPKKVETMSLTVPQLELTTSHVANASSSKNMQPTNHPTESALPSNPTLPPIPLFYHNQQPTFAHSTDQTSRANLHSQSKGKAKLEEELIPPPEPTISAPSSPAIGQLEHEALLKDLETRLAAAHSAADTWKHNHMTEVSKTEALEEIVEVLTADKTALQATIQLLEAETAQLQKKLARLHGASTSTPEFKDIHIPLAASTPDKGNVHVHFTEPSFDLGFSQIDISHNPCQAMTCYEIPKTTTLSQPVPSTYRQTRSQHPFVSPPQPSAMSRLARNYKNLQAYKDLTTQNRQLVDLLASRTDLKGYSIQTFINI